MCTETKHCRTCMSFPYLLLKPLYWLALLVWFGAHIETDFHLYMLSWISTEERYILKGRIQKEVKIDCRGPFSCSRSLEDTNWQERIVGRGLVGEERVSGRAPCLLLVVRSDAFIKVLLLPVLFSTLSANNIPYACLCSLL